MGSGHSVADCLTSHVTQVMACTRPQQDYRQARSKVGISKALEVLLRILIVLSPGNLLPLRLGWPASAKHRSRTDEAAIFWDLAT